MSSVNLSQKLQLRTIVSELETEVRNFIGSLPRPILKEREVRDPDFEATIDEEYLGDGFTLSTDVSENYPLVEDRERVLKFIEVGFEPKLNELIKVVEVSSELVSDASTNLSSLAEELAKIETSGLNSTYQDHILSKLEEADSRLHESASEGELVPGKFVSILYEKFTGRLWRCKNLSTLLAFFDFNNKRKEDVEVLDRTLFYFLLHKIYDEFQPENTSKERFYADFLDRYDLRYSSFKDKKDPAVMTKNITVKQEIAKLFS